MRAAGGRLQAGYRRGLQKRLRSNRLRSSSALRCCARPLAPRLSRFCPRPLGFRPDRNPVFVGNMTGRFSDAEKFHGRFACGFKLQPSFDSDSLRKSHGREQRLVKRNDIGQLRYSQINVIEKSFHISSMLLRGCRLMATRAGILLKRCRALFARWHRIRAGVNDQREPIRAAQCGSR